jgi:glyoxylase-like metal-dependent hydrolase (beta-lactamase superfamily II)
MSSTVRITLFLLVFCQLLQVQGADTDGREVPDSRAGALQSDAGAAPGSVLPLSAIDTTDIPRINIAAGASVDQPLPYYRIGENTFFLYGNIATVDEKNRGLNGNAGFIVTSEGVIIIDTLGTPGLGQRLIATIRAVTDRPIRYVIITHNHPDHAYGSAAFQGLEGVTIITHKGSLEYTQSDVQTRSVAYRRALLGDDMKGFEPVRADLYLDLPRFGSHRIVLGNQLIDIYNTGRHHSYGDLVVHQVKDGILWISDLAFNQRTTFLGDGDSRQILEAQDWLMNRFADAKLMVPGHGSAQRPPFPMVEKTHRYVERLRESMRTAVENDIPLMDAVDQADFPDWRDTRLYESNQRANANFIYREMEQEYFAPRAGSL